MLIHGVLFDLAGAYAKFGKRRGYLRATRNKDHRVHNVVRVRAIILQNRRVYVV